MLYLTSTKLTDVLTYEGKNGIIFKSLIIFYKS